MCYRSAKLEHGAKFWTNGILEAHSFGPTDVEHSMCSKCGLDTFCRGFRILICGELCCLVCECCGHQERLIHDLIADYKHLHGKIVCDTSDGPALNWLITGDWP